MLRLLLLSAFSALFVVASTVRVEADPPRYALRKLGAKTLSWDPGSLSDSGHAAFGNQGPTGFHPADGTPWNLWYFDGRESTVRPALGGHFAGASDIDNSGRVIGWATTSELIERRIKPTSMTSTWSERQFSYRSLGTAYEIVNSPLGEPIVAAMNDASEIVGMVQLNEGSHAAYWSSDLSFVDLGKFGGEWAGAVDVNEHSQILVGVSKLSDDGSRSQHHTIVTHGDALTEIEHTKESLSGNALNNLGQVVGWMVEIYGESGRAFSWSPATGLVDLNLPGSGSDARDVNDHGVVVGRRDIYRLNGLAFAYTSEDGWFDLQDRLVGSSKWELYSASDVNSSGQILAVGREIGDSDTSGYWDVVMLTPVPEPPGAWLAIAFVTAFSLTKRVRTDWS